MTTLPMFPLGTVLFPFSGLPLRVFEPRYQHLLDDVLHGDRRFGVVLIERGHEVGGGDERFDVGTVAEVVDAAPYGDGQWGVLAVGTVERFRVEEWLPEEPYPRGAVTMRPPGAPPSFEARRAAEQAVRRALALSAELGAPAAATRLVLHDDAEVAGWQLAAAAPIATIDRQRLLETDDADERLGLLAKLAAEAADVLAYRLSGG